MLVLDASARLIPTAFARSAGSLEVDLGEIVAGSAARAAGNRRCCARSADSTRLAKG